MEPTAGNAVGARWPAGGTKTGETVLAVRSHMNTVDLPGFTADASLYKTAGHYRTCAAASNRPADHRGTIRLAAIDVPGEVIEIEDDAPWSPPSWGGHTGPGSSGGSGETGNSEGGPGGGDGGIPSTDPYDKPAPYLHGCSNTEARAPAAQPCLDQVASDLMNNVKPPHYMRCRNIRNKKGKIVGRTMECCQKQGNSPVCRTL